MGNESGTWIMHGLSEDDPACIHTVSEAAAAIDRAGFLPLFQNDIPGFSLEEMTSPDWWWSGNREKDPWEWRGMIAAGTDIAYGKFFDKKAGFISRKWLPYFVNCRRDGYDFDALWDDEKAKLSEKRIMDLFGEGHESGEIFSFEIKEKAGFGKGGTGNFEGTLTGLQTKLYLCVRDFRQKKNKKGQAYGWAVAVYALPEHLWGKDFVTSRYGESPAASAAAIAAHARSLYPGITEKQLRKLAFG